MVISNPSGGDMDKATYDSDKDGRVEKAKQIIACEPSASDVLRKSVDAETNLGDTTYTMLPGKEITIPAIYISGTFRIKYSVQSVNNRGADCARLYKDGVAVGTEYCNLPLSYSLKSQDLTLVGGEKIQVYGKKDGAGAGDPIYVKEFRVYCDNAVITENPTW